MRFASNRYPDEYLAVFEYDSGDTEAAVGDENVEALEERIGEVLDETSGDRVDAIGHSLGTAVLQRYLADESRAETVAKYVNVDGREADEPPGGVDTLAVWAMGNADASIGGAENVYIDDQTHVEVATGRETFEAIYPFLTGREPRTSRIRPEPASRTTVAGRATIFPENEGVTDATLEAYEIDPATGHRREDQPVEREDLAGDGSWGPFDLDVTQRHEFVVRRDDALDHHVYRLPPVRSTQFVRLQLSAPGSFLGDLIDTGPDHVVISISRDREFWGDTDERDELLIDGRNVITPATAPRSERINAPFVYDARADGETNLDGPIPGFRPLPFLTGIDLHLPAANPPDDTVTIGERPRTENIERMVNVPNWVSDDHRVAVQLPDHTQQRRTDRRRHRRWHRRRRWREVVARAP